jgi:formylglycine-generating enzyme required for sulfatase activity
MTVPRVKGNRRWAFPGSIQIFWFALFSSVLFPSCPARHSAARDPSLAPIAALLIPGGEFAMGSDALPRGAESPAHRVSLNPFYLSTTEITVRQFREFISATGYLTDAEREGSALVFDRVVGEGFRRIPGASWKTPGFAQGDDHPASCLTWSDAVRFCAWRSAADGLEPAYAFKRSGIARRKGAAGWRLPTEAEWEYAARGGNRAGGFAFSGSDDFMEVAWTGVTSGWISHPVATKSANELGIFDMSGNVAEWCSDRFGPYPGDSVRGPEGPPSGSFRVLRGGSWMGFAHPTEGRVEARRFSFETDAYDYMGFRVARDAPR